MPCRTGRAPHTLPNMSFPDSYRCKLTYDIMKDPVMDSDGNSYERSAIETWLSSHPTSPITRRPLRSADLIPNRDLKAAIEEFLATHPQALSGAAGTAETAITAGTFVNAPLTVSGQTYKIGSQTYLSVEVSAPADGETQPLDLIVYLDTSGSMGMDVVTGEGAEQKRIPRLFLAKHGIRVLAALLGATHRLCIISFSSSARIVLPFTAMNAAGLAKVDALLASVQADGQTNLWDAIRLGLEVANGPSSSSRGRHLVSMMFTDGEPTVEPPRGTLPTILGTASPSNPWTLHTFGFGSQLDSDLLVKIAQWGGGRFGFIPSGDMLGTVFINAVANRLSVAHQGTTITCTSRGSPITLKTGPLRFGQPRHFVIPVPELTYTLACESATVVAIPGTVPAFAEARREYLNLLHLIQSSFTDMGARMTAETVVHAFASRYAAATDDRILALVRDLRSTTRGEAQITLAMNFGSTWGAHYVRAYTMAQEHEECMNFKDPGLQIYGGASFAKHQEAGDKLFVTLPPMPEPVPMASYSGSGSSSGGYYGAHTVPVSRPVVSMSSYHDRGGSCFTGESLVLLADGSSKAVAEIRRGDRVKTLRGSATVEHAIVFHNAAPTQQISRIGALGITPWHPIVADATSFTLQWMNPADLVGYTEEVIPALYNFVLDEGHIVHVGGTWCCTLGHEFMEPGIYHAFFGSRSKILSALCRQPGFAEGRPVFQNCVGVVNSMTGLITDWEDKRV